MQLGGGALDRDRAGFQHVGVIGQAQRHFGVLLDQDDGHAALVDLDDDLGDLPDHDRRQAERGLVQQEKLGPRYRKKIESDCDAFVDIRDLSTIDTAKRIREDDIDILVDLKGHTKDHRLGICALRPALILATYLGFPGTTGANFFDYVITDRTVTPEEQAPYYTEKFAYLPHCYQVNDHTQAISDKPYARVDFGLPEDGFVFCSFNQSYKIEPVMWDVWMRIMRHVDGSILWLLDNNEMAKHNLKREASARDVNPDRIVFAAKLPKPEHLARLKLADLFLDTRIYNAHTTGSDALWAGVPLITLQGKHFASRVASSLLGAIDLPELVTHSLADYEALAVRLARHSDALLAFRERLSRNRLTKPLFDTPRFARNLENAYQQMWDAHLSGNHPQTINAVETDVKSSREERSLRRQGHGAC